MIPLVGFLPADDPRMVGTVAAIERELCATASCSATRPTRARSVDGLPPGEGAFLPCTFWLADNLALTAGSTRRRRCSSVCSGCGTTSGCSPSWRRGASVVFLGEQPDVVAYESRRSKSSSASSRRPCSARLSASQNVQGRKAPSPGGRPSTPVLSSVGSAARNRRASSSRSIAVDRAAHARVVGRQEADQRDHQQARVQLAASRRTGRRCLRSASKPCSQTSAWISSRSRSPASTGPSSPKRSTALTAAVERDPGHHLRVGEVPARAAHLPDALVGLVPRRPRGSSSSARCERPGRPSAWPAAARARCSASITSP